MALTFNRMNLMQIIAAKLLDEHRIGDAVFTFEELEWTKLNTAVIIVIDEPNEKVFAKVTTPYDMKADMIKLKEKIERGQSI